MDSEQIFLETLQDIRVKIKSTFLTVQQDQINPSKKYSLIKACGLLRHLFLDDSNLLDTVNKGYKIPIIFHVNNYKNFLAKKDHNSLWFTLIPFQGHGIKVKLKEFLKITPLIEDDYAYSVKEIINITSHVSGGVHLRLPRTDREKRFTGFNRKHMEDGVYMSIYSICFVSLDALKPLEQAIRSHPPTGGY